MPGMEEGTPLEEALALSEPGMSALAAASRDEDDDLDFDDDDFFADDDDGPLMRTGDKKRAERAAAARVPSLAEDPEFRDLNNPDVVELAEPPMLGSRSGAEMFGNHAEAFGRPTSPKLYASAGQHPNCVQFRVWRMENGIPVGLGPIDAEATEEDFVRVFYSAMPKPGEGKFQFRCRPIDQRGNELGKEFIVNISEHNVALRQMRSAERRRMMEQGGYGDWNGMGGVPGMPGMPGMGRDRGRGDVIVQGGDATASMAEEMGRMFENAVSAAEDQTRHLQATLEMERDRMRAEEKDRAEERVSMAQRASDTTEKMMERLMASDRTRSEEQMKAQRQHSDLLMTTLTTVFQQQQEAARQQADRMRDQDATRVQQDREYFERQRTEAEDRRRRERDEYEQKRQAETEQMRIEAARKEKELEARRDLEREEARMRLEREKMEFEQRRDELRQERNRMRQEAEERRQREQQEFERKLQLEREERERRERADRDRWEREKLEYERKREEERRAWDRREERRREEMQIQVKQMEMNAQRDREHSERMAEMARIEREAQREAALQREKTEREAREASERERQRQFDLQKFEMEQAKERDREHAERMMQMQKVQNSGGLGNIGEMLGMETPELLGRLFGGDEDSGWADAIPKMLGSLGEIGKAVVAGQAGSPNVHGRVPRTDSQQRIPIQTPQGVRMITVDELRELQTRQATMSGQGAPMPAVPAPAPLEEPKDAGFPSMADTSMSPRHVASEDVDTSARAKAAGMELKEMRNARRGLRNLAGQLAKAPESEWEGVIAAALMAEPSILSYIVAVTAYAAFAETKADPELIERVVTAMRKSELVPDGMIPYNEADLASMQAEGGA